MAIESTVSSDFLSAFVDSINVFDCVVNVRSSSATASACKSDH